MNQLRRSLTDIEGPDFGPRSATPTGGVQRMSDTGRLPAGLALVAVDRVQPCPIQPRVNFSVDLIEQLSSSIRAGRHQPLLEVEPAPGAPGCYQIVCGEQRWRAARAAELTEVLVRLHPPLGYLERLEKQYEENRRLRADLDPVEEAHCLTVTWNGVMGGAMRGSKVGPLPIESNPPRSEARTERVESFRRGLRAPQGARLLRG
jgi:ParB-like nuclease domain